MHCEMLAGQISQSESVLGIAIVLANLDPKTVCTCIALTRTNFEAGLGTHQAMWSDPL